MKSLRLRLLITLLLVLLILMTTLGFVQYHTSRQNILTAFENTTRTLTGQIARRSLVGVYSENLDQLREIASEALRLPSMIGICFVDENGRLLEDFASPKMAKGEAASITLASETRYVATDKHVRVITPIILEPTNDFPDERNVSGSIVGYVQTTFSYEVLDRALRSIIMNVVVSELLIAGAFLLLVVFLELWVTRPLTTIIAKVKQMAAGDLSARVIERFDAADDIGELVRNINMMADALQKHTAGLETLIADQTRQIQARERQLMFQEKMASLGRMSASIAHEINNPLNYISLGIEYLESRERKLQETDGACYPEQVVERGKVFTDIRHGLGRMRDIIDALRKFARTDENDLRLYLFADVFHDTLRFFQPEIRKLGVSVESSFGIRQPIYGSVIRMQQILFNLLRNSLDAFENLTTRPFIQIKADEVDGAVRIFYQDNGPGIAEENRERVFEPFFTTKPPGKGTGLGLALSYEMIARDGGTIKLTRGTLGGAAFEIILPVQAHS